MRSLRKMNIFIEKTEQKAVVVARITKRMRAQEGGQKHLTGSQVDEPLLEQWSGMV